ncbi:MAG: Ig-like domain-containing protein [Ferruginibacter sp.]
MQKISTKIFLPALLWRSLLMFCLLFSGVSYVASGQCTSNNTLLCASTVPDAGAIFTGNGTTMVNTAGSMFITTGPPAATQLSITSRVYRVTTAGCVVVNFTQGGTASVQSTDISVTTSTGVTVTCTNVTLNGGNACVQICDPAFTVGTLVTFKLDFNATTTFSGTNVILSAFATANVAGGTNISCPASFVCLNNTSDCTPCDGAFTILAGKIRVFFTTPIPIGTPTPVVNEVAELVAGLEVTRPELKLCISADQGSTVVRNYVDYCVYTNMSGSTLPLTNLILRLQAFSFPQISCPISLTTIGCPSGFSQITDGRPCTPCDGAYTTSLGKIRVFFPTGIPAGVPSPEISDVTGGILTAGSVKLCALADAGTNVARTYVDYCIFTNLGPITFPFNLPLDFTVLTNSCSVPSTCLGIPPVVLPACNLGSFVVIDDGNSGGTGGGLPPANCAATTTCNGSLVYLASRLRVNLTTCLPAGIPAPQINSFQTVNADGSLTFLNQDYCFIVSDESTAQLGTVRCFIEYCVYSKVLGDNFFVAPPGTIQFNIVENQSIGGIPTLVTVSCPASLVPKTNPDVNATFVNVSVSGDVSTNDIVSAGTIYGTPVLISGPAGGTINMNPDGTYNFITPTAGVYIYDVPVCAAGQLAPCPVSKLKITVLNPLAINKPPVANADIASTMAGVAVTINTLANDRCSNMPCSLNPATVVITVNPDNGTATVNSGTGEITYTPAPGFTGMDTLTYQVCDNSGLCATAQQFITVYAPSAINTNTTAAADDYYNTFVGAAIGGNVKLNDIDPQGNTLTVTPQNTTVAEGTLVLNSDGTFTFNPALNFTGPVHFDYQVCDNGVPQSCVMATLYILVFPLAPTPVSITAFDYKVNSCEVALHWQTAGEVNSLNFKVQRATNGVDWKSIATITAAGNSQDINNYAFTDITPVKNALNYYRFVAEDRDGTLRYSEILKVVPSCGPKQFVMVSPNPFKDKVTLYFASAIKGKGFIKMYDYTGRTLLSKNVTIQNGTNEIVIPGLSHLSSGTYFIQMKTDEGVINAKLVKE